VIPTALLSDRALYEPYEGAGAHGPLFAPAVEIAGRLEPRRTVVHTGDGTEVVSSAAFFARPSAPIAPEGRLSCDGRSYRVLDVATRKAGSRSVYLEVMLG